MDFFTIDYNEELSGVYGPYLQNQTVFLNQAIKVIKRLYYKKNQNENKLIVIAHSFGGIIFKGLINLPSFNLDDIFLLLTLATPHHRSVFPFDTSFYSFYLHINERLRTDLTIFEKYQKIAKISIGGGLNDNLVRSDLTNTEELNQWSLTSTALPEVWVAADHKCIVWCRQLIKKLVHLIYDLLEERYNDIRLLNRNEIIEHHLNYRFNDRLTPRFRLKSTLSLAETDKKMKRYQIDKRLFVLDKPKVIDTLIYQFKFVQNTFVSILSTNLHKSDWIYACNTNSHCQSVQNFSNLPVPSMGEFDGVKRNHFILDSNEYLDQNYTNLALKLSPSTIRTAFQFERIIKFRRDRQIELPNIFHRLVWLFNPFQTAFQISVGEESTFYNLTLNNFDQIWHNYNLKLEIGRCYPQAKEETVLRLHVPWYKEDRLHVIKTKQATTFNTVLNLNVPQYNSEDQRKITLQLLLDPYCQYRLKFKFSLRETLIQLFRHYAYLFLPIAASIILATFSVQIRAGLNDADSDRNELIQKTEHFSTLKYMLTYHIDEITYFSIVPALPYLIHICLNRMYNEIWGFHNYLESNQISLKYTRHDSHINSLFASYLVYAFVYFILFIIVHLFSYLFKLIINLSQFIYLNR